MDASRILVVRLTALGDVVLVEPVLRTLRSAFPGTAIDLLTDVRFAPLMAGAAGADVVVGYDRRGEHAGLQGMTRLIASLPAQHYRAVVDLQGKLRTRVLCQRISADARVVLRKRNLAQAISTLFGRETPINDRHSVTLYFEALVPLLGELPDPIAPRLHLPHPEKRSGRLRIGLGVGTTHPTKRWPIERFSALAAEVGARHPRAQFVILGGPSDREELSRLSAAIEPNRLDPIDVAGLDIRGLAGLISGLDLWVGVDSGPAHIAAALGIPTVVLFGPTSSVRWGPLGPPHRSVSLRLDCAPCTNFGGAECPRPDRARACLAELDPAQVLEVMEQVLEGLEGQR